MHEIFQSIQITNSKISLNQFANFIQLFNLQISQSFDLTVFEIQVSFIPSIYIPQVFVKKKKKKNEAHEGEIFFSLKKYI